MLQGREEASKKLLSHALDLTGSQFVKGRAYAAATLHDQLR
jgi:hypothetical protein